jgi:2-C-methyl-D-erythritol 4-phosphate cytidylyltransferase / 2-C-methyl-D-erythritol 2,4-cyclodiphosphate synthase
MPKALVPLAGRPMLHLALDGVLASGVDRVVVAGPAGGLDAVRAVVAARTERDRVAVVAGGDTRQRSVALALESVADDEIVLVHDAARPLTPSAQFDLVAAAVRARGGGVVPALAPADTVKEVDGDAVVATLDRSRLAAVQTPQGFPAGDLRRAYAAASDGHTDDASVFAAAGMPVTTVAGDAFAFKVTTAWDLRRAEQLLAPVAATRTGIGIDVHAVEPERPLHLGGLEWPGEPGLAGHSDADVVCHAIADALLSAGGLGDLGSRFGVDRAEEAGRPGVDFVTRSVALLAAAGLQPLSVAVQVVGNRPKIGPRRDEIVRVLSAAVGAPVSVAGTTTDGLGLTGRGEGVAAIATALVGDRSPGTGVPRHALPSDA